MKNIATTLSKCKAFDIFSRTSNQNLFRHITMWQRFLTQLQTHKPEWWTNPAYSRSGNTFSLLFRGSDGNGGAKDEKWNMCGTFSDESQFDSILLEHFTEPMELRNGKSKSIEVRWNSDCSDEHKWRGKLYWWLHILPEKTCYDCSTMGNH